MTPTEEVLITIGASEALDVRSGHHLTRRRGDPARTVVRLVSAGDHLRWGVPVGVPTTIDEDFALDPVKVEAAITPRTKGHPAQLPLQPDLARSCLTKPRMRSRALPCRHDLLVYSDEILRPARVRRLLSDREPWARLPGMRRRTVLMGGFLQGLRDDGLAHRLHLCPHRRSSKES